jgi:hypothetical protein
VIPSILTVEPLFAVDDDFTDEVRACATAGALAWTCDASAFATVIVPLTVEVLAAEQLCETTEAVGFDAKRK